MLKLSNANAEQHTEQHIILHQSNPKCLKSGPLLKIKDDSFDKTSKNELFRKND